MSSEDRIRVVLVSPGDVAKERAAAKVVIEELNRGVATNRLVLWGWDTDARPGLHREGPQGLIDDLSAIQAADVVIGVFWTRFGTPTHDATSATEHELRRAWNAWRQSGLSRAGFRGDRVWWFPLIKRWMPAKPASGP